MSKKITHAVIPVAGFGTRMLPLSKAVPKELLPLGNKPAIQYVVEEAIAAGLTNIVLVNHAQKTAIENYFDINSELDTQLRAKGKAALADSLNWLPAGVTVTSVRQGKPLGLGHAVLQARAIVGDEPFAVLLPDVILNPYNTDYTQQNLAYMLQQFAKQQHSQILVDPVKESDISKYGIAKLASTQMVAKSEQNQSFAVMGFVEKPKAEDAPSNLAVVGRYVFNNAIFDYLANTQPSVGGEIQLTDAIDALISTQGVDVVSMVGNSFDAGDMNSYLQAVGYFATQLGIEAFQHTAN
ncbi:UTP--glucose-1-phosphate uridylyltransferase [Moraxella osloensis]|nr:UTP--glucose-1-phosphate uridylyltransferase [Moraxella osloensis]MDK1670851.1 UTP--glucose-1-phosphate uridylyltransferase [Moraxella osloensis]